MGFVAGLGALNCDLLYAGMPKIPNEGEEVYAESFDIQLGGGTASTLINLARLNINVKLATFLGGDFFSHFVEERIREHGLEYVNFYTGEGKPTAVSSTIITKHDRTFVSFRNPIFVNTEKEEEIYKYLRGAKIVTMGNHHIDVYKKLKESGSVLIFDTGWEDSLSIEKYADYIEIADYYTPNSKEALKITGTRHVDDALNVLANYVKMPLLKLDKEGCLIKENGEIKIIPPLRNVIAVDSTGAGDAFLSGLIYGLFHEYPFSDCVKFGNIVGGVCVQGVGCLTKAVDEKTLLELLPQLA